MRARFVTAKTARASFVIYLISAGAGLFYRGRRANLKTQAASFAFALLYAHIKFKPLFPGANK
jgi:hypothetical protein